MAKKKTTKKTGGETADKKEVEKKESKIPEEENLPKEEEHSAETLEPARVVTFLSLGLESGEVLVNARKARHVKRQSVVDDSGREHFGQEVELVRHLEDSYLCATGREGAMVIPMASIDSLTINDGSTSLAVCSGRAVELDRVLEIVQTLDEAVEWLNQ